MLIYNKKLFFFIEYLIKNLINNELNEKSFQIISSKLFNSEVYFEQLLSKQNVYLEVSKYLDFKFHDAIINKKNNINLEDLHVSDKIKELIFQRVKILTEINFVKDELAENNDSLDSNQDIIDNINENSQDNIQDADKENTKDDTNAVIDNIDIFASVKKIYIFSKEYNFIKHNINLLKASWNTADTIWKLMNDKSTDINFYTKRTSLAIICNLVLNKYLSSYKYKEEDKIKEYIASLIDSYINFIKKFK